MYEHFRFTSTNMKSHRISKKYVEASFLLWLLWLQMFLFDRFFKLRSWKKKILILLVLLFNTCFLPFFYGIKRNFLSSSVALSKMIITSMCLYFSWNLASFLGSKAIGVRGGLDLHGQSPGVHWTSLNQTANVGDNEIVLEEEVDWKVGDEIVITTTGYR